MTRRPVPSVNLVINQPLIGAAHRNRNVHQEVTGRKCDKKPSDPWPGTFPKVSLPAKNQAENFEESSPCAFVCFDQITHDCLALLTIEKPGSKFYNGPRDSAHKVFPVRLSTHDAPRLMR